MAFCFLFDLAHCSQYCWLNVFFVQASKFGLAAMAEVVVERPGTIFIGTAKRFAKGVEHVWRYKLTFVGAECIYVCMEPPSTTHAGDLMFIMEEVVEGNKWYGAYEGRPVSNAEGEQELEKRAAVFRTSASFWENGVHEWKTNDVRSRATYTDVVEEPRWKNRGGKRRASWFAHATRTSCGTTARIASLGLNGFLAGRSDACGVCVCVRVELEAFCIFGLNCLLAGRSDAVRAMTLDRHKVVMDITFVAWCAVKLEFAELFFF